MFGIPRPTSDIPTQVHRALSPSAPNILFTLHALTLSLTPRPQNLATIMRARAHAHDGVSTNNSRFFAPLYRHFDLSWLLAAAISAISPSFSCSLIILRYERVLYSEISRVFVYTCVYISWKAERDKSQKREIVLLYSSLVWLSRVNWRRV